MRMSSRPSRPLRRSLPALAALAALAVAVGALPLFLWGTAKPLHPDPQHAPSASQPEPLPQWIPVVGRARQLVRAALSERNLPGLSVAVAVGTDLVWAEG